MSPALGRLRPEPALRDRALDRRLRRRGLVRLDGYARADVSVLRRVFEETHPPGRHTEARSPGDRADQRGRAWRSDPAPGPRFTTDLEAPFEDRDRIEALLAPFWRRVIADLFVHHRPLVSTFLMKWPGDSSLTLHQDPTYVDESRSRSLTFWVALDDADPDRDNGPLYVLPASHRLGNENRGTSTPSTYLDYLDGLWDRAVPVPVRAGDALVLDGRLIHGSPPNRSDELRLALAAAVAPVGEQLLHVVGDGGQSVVIHEVDESFYRRTSPNRLIADPPEPPAGAVLRPRAPRPYRLDAFG